MLAQLKRTHEGVKIPRLVFTKGGGQWLEAMAELDCEVLGLDWTVNLGQARARVGDRMALQGNLDPNVLFADQRQIEAEVVRVLSSFGSPHLDTKKRGPTHIFNLGHGISQHTPPESVNYLVEAVHAHSRAMRGVPA